MSFGDDTLDPVNNSPKKMNREQYLKRFKEITEEMLELTARKNNDYGGVTDPFKNFRKHGAYGILVRMDDKLSRIESVVQEKRDLHVSSETLIDTITDIAVYAVIMRCIIEAEKDGCY